jgi:hypothetical protein
MAGGISTVVSGHEVTKILIKLKEDFPAWQRMTGNIDQSPAAIDR